MGSHRRAVSELASDGALSSERVRVHLLSAVVVIAGVLACCVGALLVSVPVLVIGNAYVYLKLIGEQPRHAV